MPATLETVDGKLTHLVTVAEVTAQRVERLEDSYERILGVERSLRGLAERVSSAALRMSARLALAAAIPPFHNVALVTVGAFAGGLVGTVLWHAIHAATAVAAP
jgi:hypothetical protein